MADKFIHMTPELHQYIVRLSAPKDPVLARLIAETEALGDISIMQIAPDQGAFLTLLVRTIGARSALEIGTFTGYSAISIARGLPDDGRLLCCDVSEEWTSIARRYFRESGVERKIELRIAPALETLESLPASFPLDFAFVDADKPAYAAYYDWIVERLRPGGVVTLDNVLWSGKVIDPSDERESTVAVRKLNEKVAADERVDSVILPIADGLTIARKR